LTLDILLLGGTIVVAVGAVIVGLLRAVLERRRAPSMGAQYRSRRIETARLARAVPGPTAADGSIRALELQAPAIGSRSSYATLGVPVVADPVPVMAEPVVVLPEPVPLVPEAIEATVAVPDAAFAAVVAAPEPELVEVEPELVEIAPEPVMVEPVPVMAEPGPELVEPVPVMAEPEATAHAPRSRPTAPEFAWVTPAVAAATPEPVTEDIVETLPAVATETEVGAEAATEAEPDIAAAAAAPEAEPAAPGPVPLFLPGTYPVAEADLAPENGNLVPMPATAPAAKATAAMVAGYAPVARAIVRPPEPDGYEDELAYRIGIPGAKRPERPSVIEVAGGQEVVVPVLPTVETEAWPERRSRRRRRAAIGLAALVGATSLALAVAFIVPNLPQSGSGVLDATGTPAPTNDAGPAPQGTPMPAAPATPTVLPASAAPVASPSPALTASPSPSPSAAATEQVKTASVTPRPVATPRAVAPKPTIKPTTKPTPTPVHRPVALFDCVAVGLTLHCDGSDSRFAESYSWDFGLGPTQSGKQASHDFDSPGGYVVTLTVKNSSGTDSDSRPYTVSAP
jgi:hypothetical protein